MKNIQWYKINLPMNESEAILKRFTTILNFIETVKINDVLCYTKVAHNGSCNVFLTQEIVKQLESDLQRYKPVKCPPPTKKSDDNGTFLAYMFGNSKLLFNSENEQTN